MCAPKRWWRGKRLREESLPVDTSELPVVPDDREEAKEMREEAEREMIELREQAHLVSYLTNKLVERRRANHFGDELTVTFKPRGRAT